MKKMASLACFALLTLMAGVASAQTYNATISAPGGTLSYTATATAGNCGSGGFHVIFYQRIVYSNFSYTVSGTTYPLTGTDTAILIVESGGGTNCITNSDPPVTLKTPIDEIVFTPTPNNNGAAPYLCNQNCADGSAAPAPGLTGWVNPKYKIVGIAYTVPGEQSYVQYTDTTMMGTSSSTSSSFSTNVASSLEICGGAGIGSGTSKIGTTVCGTYSNGFDQESDTSSSFAVNQSTSFINQWFPLTGPALDHGNDVIYVWVNPQVWYTMYTTDPTGPTPLYWNGYTYDPTDDSNNMEVLPLRLSWLQNPSEIPSGIQGRLLRAWAPNNTDGTGPAITNQDLLNIAAADPFSNPNYVVTIGSDGKTTTDKRFTQTTNGELFYLQGFDNTYNWVYTTTDTEGQGGKATYSEGFAIEVKNSAGFIGGLSYDWKESTTFTWVDQWNVLMTQMMTQMNSVSIHGWTPPYTGPDEFNIYQDNVYGTFMVAPVPSQ